METIAEKLSEIEMTARSIGYGKGDERKDIKDSVGSCNKHGKSSKETGRTK